MIFFIILISSISLVFITCGCYMIYSAITGKGTPDPGPDALYQFRLLYKLRGLYGLLLIFIGVLFIAIIIYG